MALENSKVSNFQCASFENSQCSLVLIQVTSMGYAPSYDIQNLLRLARSFRKLQVLRQGNVLTSGNNIVLNFLLFCGAKSMEQYLITFVQTDSVMWRQFEIGCSASQQGSETKDFKQCGKDSQIPYRNSSCSDHSGCLIVSSIL